MKLYSFLLFSLLASLPTSGGTADVRYRVVPLESSPNTDYRFTQGTSINDNGMIAGLVYRREEFPYSSGSIKGVFVHDPITGFEEIGDYKGALSQPNRINNRGQFTVLGGRGFQTNGVDVYVEDAVRYTPGVGFEQLGDLGGTTTQATGINSQGDVVGWGYASNETQFTRAFLYTDSRGIVDLGTFGGTGAGAADINDDGWICGGVVIPGQGNTAWIYHEWAGLTILGHGTAKRINERRTVVCDNDGLDPVLIREGVVIPLLGSAEISPAGFSGDLNDWDVVVGTGNYRINGLDYVGGYIWNEREGMRNLNILVGTNSGWKIWDTFDINNRGQITGVGIFEARKQAFRLDPIPPKPTITRNGTNVVVSWSPAWPGIKLESTGSLSSTNWASVEASATNEVRLSLQGTNRFFRLNVEALKGLCCAPE